MTGRTRLPIELVERKPGPAASRYRNDGAAQMLGAILIAIPVALLLFAIGVQVGKRSPVLAQPPVARVAGQ